MRLRPKAVSGEIGANQPESAELAHQAAHLAHFRRKGEPDTVTRDKARGLFLEVYACVAPGLWGGLLAVLPFVGDSLGIRTEEGRRILHEGRAAFDPEYHAPADAVSDIDFWPAVQADRPELANALSEWARGFHLTFNGEPAGWAMDTALSTLLAWRLRTSRRQLVCVKWHHAVEMHGEYPASDPTFYSAATGESEGEVGCLSISPWNRPGGETEGQFRKRARRAVDEYIRQMKKWTGKPEKTEWWHFNALGLWQAGHSLASIRHSLATDYLNVGSVSDLSPISKGLSSAAVFIEIDRRPA